MAKYKEKPVFQWVYTGISVGIVLFFLLLLASSFILTGEFLKKSKEKMSFAVEFNTSSTPAAKDSLLVFLQNQEYYLDGSYDYRSRDSIAELFNPQLEDSLSAYLDLPFRDVAFFNIRESFINATDVVLIKTKLLKQKNVEKVYHEKVNVEKLNRNMNKVLWALSAISILLLTLTFLFLYNTLKMALNYRSDIIYNQLLLGASPLLIARPMILRVLLTGILSAIASMLIFWFLLQYSLKMVAGLGQLWNDNIVIYLGLLIALILLTILVFSVIILRKSLRLMRWEN